MNRHSTLLNPPKPLLQLQRIKRYLATGLIAVVCGCSSLPVIVPAMTRPQASPVQLEGARGPLTARQSKAVLERLQSRGKETSIFDRHLAIEEAITGSPLMTGNRVSLLIDGPATYQRMFAAIRSAKSHINMETYIIEDDEVGNRFADALIEKRAQGVTVNLIYDSVGCLTVPAAFFKRLTDSGIRVLEFNPVNPMTAKKGWEVNQRDHRKLLIIDGQTAFLGGINISSVYSGGSYSHAKQRPAGGPPWRDTHLEVGAPSSANFRNCFLPHGKSKRANRSSLETIFRNSRVLARKSYAPSAVRRMNPTA